MTTVSVRGADELQKKLVKLAEKANDAQLKTALLAGAKPIENTAVAKAPIDTGTLRRSIHSEAGRVAGGLVVRIGTNVEYGLYQEMGTRRMRAQPYLRPAFNQNRVAALREIMRALKAMVQP